MAIDLGTGLINKLYLGTGEVKKVYLGTTLIHDKTGGGGGGDLTVTPASSAYGTGTTSLTGVAIGTASSNRRVVAMVQTNSASSTFTIGGVAAVIHSTVALAGIGGGYWSYLISAVVTTGTTATIANTGAGSEIYAGHTWAVDGAASVFNDMIQIAGTGTADMTSTIDVADGGVICADAGHVGAVGFTWTGVTESHDNLGGPDYYSMAAIALATGETGRTVTAAHTAATTQNMHLLAVSFSPV